jgi:predicted transcriptional regulator
MVRVGLALLVGLVALVPGAEAGVCRDFFAAHVGLEEAYVDLGIAYFGEDAAEARKEIDLAVGNHDRDVSAAEVEKYEKKYTFDGDDFSASCAKNFAFLTIDDALPVGLLEFRKIMWDAEGPVRNDPLWYQIRLTLEYPPNDGEFGLVHAKLGDFERFRAGFECAVPSIGTGWWGDHICGTKPGDALSKPKFYGVSAGWGYRILPETIAPTELQRIWRDEELRGDTLEEQSLLRMNVATLKIAKTHARMPAASFGPAIGAASAGLLALGAATVLWTSELRYPLSRWFFALPFFSRLDRDSAVDHPRRQEVLAAIEASPGISLNELGRRTEIPKGALTHHLRVLERLGLLTSRRERIWTRFFPPHHVRRRIAIVTTRQEDVTQLLSREPGLSQSDLALRLGLQRKAAQYHLDRLEEAGVVRSDRAGRKTVYFLPDPVASRPVVPDQQRNS